MERASKRDWVKDGLGDWVIESVSESVSHDKQIRSKHKIVYINFWIDLHVEEYSSYLASVLWCQKLPLRFCK